MAMISWLRCPQLPRHNRHEQELQQGAGRIEGSAASELHDYRQVEASRGHWKGPSGCNLIRPVRRRPVSDNLVRSTFPISSSRAKIALQQRP
jgi:hypothetical protein